MFDYKVKRISNSFKVGFPISSLDNVVARLDQEKTNYIVVDGEKIIEKSYDDNNYFKYKFDMEEVLYNYLRVEKIVKCLEDNLMSNEFNGKLKEIEKILYSD